MARESGSVGSQPAITRSALTIETLEQVVKYAQSYHLLLTLNIRLYYVFPS